MRYLDMLHSMPRLDLATLILRVVLGALVVIGGISKLRQ